MTSRAAIILFVPILLGLLSGQAALRAFAGKEIKAPHALSLLVWFLFLAGLLQTAWPEELFLLLNSAGAVLPAIPITQNLLTAVRMLILPFIVGALIVDLLRAVLVRSVSPRLNLFLLVARPLVMSLFILLACSALGQRAEALFAALISQHESGQNTGGA